MRFVLPLVFLLVCCSVATKAQSCLTQDDLSHLLARLESSPPPTLNKKLTEELQKKIPGEAGKALEGVLKNPQQATSNPSQAIEQGIGGLLNQPKDKKAKKPATQPK